MSSEVETSREVTSQSGGGFPDFAWNDKCVFGRQLVNLKFRGRFDRKRLDKRGKVNRVEYSRRTRSHEINGSCLFSGTRHTFRLGAVRRVGPCRRTRAE